MNVFALRLKPDDDLKMSLQNFAEIQGIEAGFMITTVGSLKQATLRFANQSQTDCLQERFEIVSLVGTLSVHGSHIHIALAGESGKMIGGHIVEGCLINTTAEIIIGEIPDQRFTRELDGVTGDRELVISPRMMS